MQQKSRTIRFRTAAEMLESFGMHTGGKEYRRLVAAFERIFGATIYFGTDSFAGTAKLVQRSRFNFMSEAQIWYTRSAEQRVLSSEFENVIVFTEDFYCEVTEHPVPNDLDSVKVLASAPAVLDLYMWLSYRCFKAKGPESIPIFGQFGLVAQLGSVEYSRPRRIRGMLEQWLGVIRAMWPVCPAKISSDGQRLLIDHAHAVGLIQIRTEVAGKIHRASILLCAKLLTPASFGDNNAREMRISAYTEDSQPAGSSKTHRLGYNPVASGHSDDAVCNRTPACRTRRFKGQRC